MSRSVGCVTSGWNELDGIAQIVAAGGTLILAGFTWRLAARTHELAAKAAEQVEVSGEQVEAARQEAKATEALAIEQRTDRQLAWRPHLELLSLTDDVHHPNVSHNSDRMKCWIANSGGGPALGVTVMARDISTVGRWWLLRLRNLRPGQTADASGDSWQHGKALTAAFEHFPDCDDRHIVTFVILCSDVLGRRFRFGVATPRDPIPGEPLKVPVAEISAPTDAGSQHSGWADLPLIWG